MKQTSRLLTAAMLKRKGACDGGLATFVRVTGGKLQISVSSALALYQTLPFGFLGSFLSTRRLTTVHKKTGAIHDARDEARLMLDRQLEASRTEFKALFTREGATYRERDWALTNLIDQVRTFESRVNRSRLEAEQKVAMEYAKAFIKAGK